MMRVKKIIGYFHTTATAPSARKIAGVYKAAHERGWSVIRFDVRTSASVRSELAYWQPDGCIVDAVAAELPIIRLFRKCPTVFIDCDAKILPKGFSGLYQDPETTARAAVEALVPHQLRSYGFAAWPGDPYWSHARGIAFIRQMKARGCEVRPFRTFPRNTNRHNVIQALAGWLREMTPPVGIFAVTDALSEQVVEAAHLVGLSLPDQLMVIGVDDDAFFCEHTRPMLSSISPDFEGVGLRAMEILDELMREPGHKGIREPMRQSNTVIRASTRRAEKHDARVTEALDRIRAEALSGLTASAVLEMFPCSRRLAEQRFRAFTGHSILDEIHAVQIEHAKKLIANPLQKLTAIPELCGHATVPYFQKLFLKTVGMTMSAYRSLGR